MKDINLTVEVTSGGGGTHGGPMAEGRLAARPREVPGETMVVVVPLEGVLHEVDARVKSIVLDSRQVEYSLKARDFALVTVSPRGPGWLAD